MHPAAARAAAFSRLTNAAVRYIFAIYEADSGHPGDPGPPLARASLRLRHQERRRPLDSLLLGGELRPDLPRAASPRGRRLDRGRGLSERRTRAARLQADRRRPQGAQGVAAWAHGHHRAAGRVAAAALLRGCPAARAGARAARGAQAGSRGIPGGPPRDRRAAGYRPGLRRSRPALGNRLQRVGSEMVPGAAGAIAEREDARLSEPTFWGVLLTGLPGFLREGFLPLGAFYAGLRLDGLTAGIVAAALASVLVYLYERRAGRD